MHNFSISVVIPNYNGKNLLERNLKSVYLALETSNIIDFEIIIPDDASIDDSVSFLHNNYPSIIVIQNDINVGFGGNTNKGIFKATKDLVFILNSDVELTEGYFLNLFPYFQKDDTFGVMGKIIGIDNDKIQDGAKYPKYSFGDLNSATNYISKSETELYTLFMSGANSLVNRKILIEFGGFNELFNPYYSEDVDLCLRAWRLGYKCYFEPKAVCKHPNSATIKKEPSDKVKIISKRNKMILHYFHLNNFELSYFMLILFVKQFFRSIFFDKKYRKSYSLFKALLPQIQIQKNEFEKKQKMKNVKIELKDIKKIILEKIGNKEIEVF